MIKIAKVQGRETAAIVHSHIQLEGDTGKNRLAPPGKTYAHTPVSRPLITGQQSVGLCYNGAIMFRLKLKFAIPKEIISIYLKRSRSVLQILFKNL